MCCPYREGEDIPLTKGENGEAERGFPLAHLWERD